MALRRKHTNSKLGCLNCKRRKTRCDEHLPVCHNCTKSGKEVCSYLSLSEDEINRLKIAHSLRRVQNKQLNEQYRLPTSNTAHSSTTQPAPSASGSIQFRLQKVNIPPNPSGHDGPFEFRNTFAATFTDTEGSREYMFEDSDRRKSESLERSPPKVEPPSGQPMTFVSPGFDGKHARQDAAPEQGAKRELQAGRIVEKSPNSLPSSDSLAGPSSAEVSAEPKYTSASPGSSHNSQNRQSPNRQSQAQPQSQIQYQTQPFQNQTQAFQNQAQFQGQNQAIQGQNQAFQASNQQGYPQNQISQQIPQNQLSQIPQNQIPQNQISQVPNQIQTFSPQSSVQSFSPNQPFNTSLSQSPMIQSQILSVSPAIQAPAPQMAPSQSTPVFQTPQMLHTPQMLQNLSMLQSPYMLQSPQISESQISQNSRNSRRSGSQSSNSRSSQSRNSQFQISPKQPQQPQSQQPPSQVQPQSQPPQSQNQLQSQKSQAAQLLSPKALPNAKVVIKKFSVLKRSQLFQPDYIKDPLAAAMVTLKFDNIHAKGYVSTLLNHARSLIAQNYVTHGLKVFREPVNVASLNAKICNELDVADRYFKDLQKFLQENDLSIGSFTKHPDAQYASNSFWQFFAVLMIHDTPQTPEFPECLRRFAHCVEILSFKTPKLTESMHPFVRFINMRFCDNLIYILVPSYEPGFFRETLENLRRLQPIFDELAGHDLSENDRQFLNRLAHYHSLMVPFVEDTVLEYLHNSKIENFVVSYPPKVIGNVLRQWWAIGPIELAENSFAYSSTGTLRHLARTIYLYRNALSTALDAVLPAARYLLLMGFTGSHNMSMDPDHIPFEDPPDKTSPIGKTLWRHNIYALRLHFFFRKRETILRKYVSIIPENIYSKHINEYASRRVKNMLEIPVHSFNKSPLTYENYPQSLHSHYELFTHNPNVMAVFRQQNAPRPAATKTRDLDLFDLDQDPEFSTSTFFCAQDYIPPPVKDVPMMNYYEYYDEYFLDRTAMLEMRID